MRRQFKPVFVVLVIVAAGALVAASLAVAGGGDRHNRADTFTAHLNGFQETPALNGAGEASFSATVASDQITFHLQYSGLSGPPLVAHVHIGQRGVAGSVSFFLCGGGGQAACPASPSGTVDGTVTAANVVGPVSQGFDAGDLTSVERAIRAGVAYANMHTTKFPAGEIRGQLVPADDRDHGGD
jgi:hypothetical protein